MSDQVFKEIIKNIKKGALSPVYFLYGEEPYYTHKIIQTAEFFIKETNNESNLFIIDVKKQTLNDVIMLLQETGMFSNFKLVIVRDAQNLKVKIKIGDDYQVKDFYDVLKGKNTQHIAPLLNFINHPIPERYVIFAFEDPDKKLDDKQFVMNEILHSPNVVAYKSEKVKEYKMKEWIKKYVFDLGRMINDRACIRLAENIGNDLMRVEREIEKIIINTPQKEEITDDHINKYTFINREYNIYELQTALAKKDVLKANMIIKYFAENKSDFPIERVLSALNAYFSKLMKYHLLENVIDKPDDYIKEQLELPHTFFVKEYRIAANHYPRPKIKQILYLMHEYDLKSKKINNYSLESGQLLQELVWKVLH